VRKSGDAPAKRVGQPPEQTEPPRPIVERVVEVDEERCPGAEHSPDLTERTLGVREMVEYAEGEGEVEAGVSQREFDCTRVGERSVG
jgi:hypothetical protein